MADTFMPVGDTAELRRAYGRFPSGVTAVCGIRGGVPFGMAASSFTTVSLDPPLVSVCLTEQSQTLRLLRHVDRIGISILAGAQGDVCRSLAQPANRFDGLSWHSSESGAVFIDAAAGWLDCTLYDELPAGDHQILLLRVHGFRVNRDSDPLVFHDSRFRELATS